MGQVGFVKKPFPEHLEPLVTDPAFTDEEIYHPSKTRLIDITRSHCATWESCRRVLSTDWTCSRLKLVRTLPTVFHRGGSYPEVVVGGGSRCNGGAFSTGSDCLLSARSESTLGHIKDRTSGPLPPRWKTSRLKLVGHRSVT